jgi:hypothetical protein
LIGDTGSIGIVVGGTGAMLGDLGVKKIGKNSEK